MLSFESKDRMYKSRANYCALLLSLWLTAFAAPACAQEIVTLSTRPGVTQSYFLTSTPKNLQAVAVLFPGSGGLIQLRSENGQAKFNQGNFLVRSRAVFVKRGVVAAIVDRGTISAATLGARLGQRIGGEMGMQLGLDHPEIFKALILVGSSSMPGDRY